MAIRSRSSLAAAIAVALAVASIASAEVFFEERFEDGWEKRWVVSDWKKDENTAGVWKHTAGNWSGDPEDKGIQTAEDYRFYAISAEFPQFTNKDKMLVLQFSVKHEQKLDCGGGYVKLLDGEIDQKKFSGDTPYSLMFGPDICGYDTKKVHTILTRNGKNYPIKKDVRCETDQLTHVYTFISFPNSTYSILVDNVQKQNGTFYDHWNILLPKKIRDPDAKKPKNWDERSHILDPANPKPEGYDDIPRDIPDPDAKKPEHWNEEEDGEWTAPMIRNPDFKPWKPKRVVNPNFRGRWRAPLIDNPAFEDDPYIYVFPNLRYIGIELWQVKSGSLFDNILICDDLEYAKKLAEETWGKHKDAEKAAFDEFQKNKAKESNNDVTDDEEDEDGDEEDGDESDTDTVAEQEKKTHDEL